MDRVCLLSCSFKFTITLVTSVVTGALARALSVSISVLTF